MSVQNADDAVSLARARVTPEMVLADVEFAAKTGIRSWVYGWLPEDTRAELEDRGFRVNDSFGHFTVEW